LEAALKMIPARTELMMVAGAGHELMSKKNQQELPGRVVKAFLEFVEQHG